MWISIDTCSLWGVKWCYILYMLGSDRGTYRPSPDNYGQLWQLLKHLHVFNLMLMQHYEGGDQTK